LKTFLILGEASRPQDGASRRWNIIYIVPLDPAYKAVSRGTCRSTLYKRRPPQSQLFASLA